MLLTLPGYRALACLMCTQPHAHPYVTATVSALATLPQQRSALHWAAAKGHGRICKALAGAGADVNRKADVRRLSAPPVAVAAVAAAAAAAAAAATS